jgi:hypothetical protein
MGMLVTWMQNGATMEMSQQQPARPAQATRQDAVIDTLLEWYEFQAEYRPKLGFERRSRESSGYRISRQWLEEADIDDEIDTHIRAQRAEEVERCVDRLEPRFRAAIQTEMRNRLAGASVFSSSRNAGTHDADLRAALALLKPMLSGRGLLD